MEYYGVWHGGSGYGQSHDWRDNLEFWPNLESVKLSLWRRWDRGWDDTQSVTIHEDPWCPIAGESKYTLTPLVEREDCYIDLFNIVSGEPYRRLTLGPRGGVRMENF